LKRFVGVKPMVVLVMIDDTARQRCHAWIFVIDERSGFLFTSSAFSIRRAQPVRNAATSRHPGVVEIGQCMSEAVH